MLDVFKKHKVKTPKEIMDKVKTKNQEDCISYLQLMEIIIKNGNISTPSESNFTFNAYLDDLSLINLLNLSYIIIILTMSLRNAKPLNLMLVKTQN